MTSNQPDIPSSKSLSNLTEGFVKRNRLAVLRLPISLFHHRIELGVRHTVTGRDFRNGERIGNAAGHDNLPIQCINENRYRQSKFGKDRFCLLLDFRLHTSCYICTLCCHHSHLPFYAILYHIVSLIAIQHAGIRKTQSLGQKGI